MKQNILWASAHAITAEQKKELEDQGLIIVPPSPEFVARWSQCPFYDSASFSLKGVKKSESEAIEAAREFLWDCRKEGGTRFIALPIGSPILMFALARVTNSESYSFAFAYSQRVSVDYIMPDGSVQKRSEFRHLGFQWI